MEYSFIKNSGRKEQEKLRKDEWSDHHVEKSVTRVWEQRNSAFKTFSEEYLPLGYFFVVPSKEVFYFQSDEVYQLFQLKIENKVKMKSEE